MKANGIIHFIHSILPLSSRLALFLVCGVALAQFGPANQTVPKVFQAIENDDTNAVKQLYAQNGRLFSAEIDTGNNSQRVPLLQAAADGETTMVALLLQYGASPDIRGDASDSFNSQMTALDEAARAGHLEVCALLLRSGAYPNFRSFSGDTALHYAFTGPFASTNQEAIASLLLDYGADPYLEAGYYKNTPVEWAITRADGRLVSRMLGQDHQHPLGKKSPIKPMRLRLHPPVSLADFLALHGVPLLAAAAQRGEVEAVQAFLKAGISPATNLPDGYSLLHSFALGAATAGQNFADSTANRWTQVRNLLLKNGADYDAFSATLLGDLPQAQHLLSADARVALSRDLAGQTPLHVAVEYDRIPLVNFWLQAGSPLAATNLAGQTALHIAAVKGWVEPEKILLAAGAATNIRDTNGWTPLDAAMRAQKTETIRLLLSDKSVPPTAGRGLTEPIHQAAAGGDIAALSALTEETNHLEDRNELGLTAVELAVRNGHLAAAALLVDKGADPTVCDPDGNTLFNQMLLADHPSYVADRPPAGWLDRLGNDPRKASFQKYLTVPENTQGPNPMLQTASFLLACGVDPAVANHTGQTPVQLISSDEPLRGIFLFDEDRVELLRLLGTGGAAVNQRDADGNTALHLAGQDSTTDRAASLIAAGADINATNKLGQTPLHKYAERIGGWDMNQSGTNEPFQLLVKSGANVNAQDNEGRTPLHVLAASETSFRKEAVRLLLDSGANPNIRDHHGRTPAHVFLSGKFPWNDAADCLAMMAKAGADLSARDDEGKTPLHYLAALGEQQPLFFMRGLAELFVAAKVDFSPRDNDGNTPLQIAARSGTRDVYDWLVKCGARAEATTHASDPAPAMAARSRDPFPGQMPPDPDSDIFTAVRMHKTDAMTRLLTARPQLANETNKFGQTPLSWAVELHDAAMIALLETNGAKWDLISAVRAGRTNELKIILRDHLEAINVAQNYELAHLAAEAGDLNGLNLLIAAHYNIQTTDSWGLSPLGRALINHHEAVADLLRAHDVKQTFFDAVYNHDLPRLTSALAHDPALAAARNRLGATAVAVAAADGDTEILKLLLKRGASPGAADPDDDSPPYVRNRWHPLHLAAFYNRPAAAKVLLQAGADVNLPDERGWAPLHWAALQGSGETAAVLLKHGATVDQKTGGTAMFLPDFGPLTHDTALHLAVLEGRTNVVNLLLKSGANVNALNGPRLTPLDVVKVWRGVMGVSAMMPRHEMQSLLSPLAYQNITTNPFPQPRTNQKSVLTDLLTAAGGTNSAPRTGPPRF